MLYASVLQKAGLKRRETYFLKLWKVYFLFDEAWLLEKPSASRSGADGCSCLARLCLPLSFEAVNNVHVWNML